MKNTSNESPLNIGIIGLGAIGCLISSQLPKDVNILALPRKTKQPHYSFKLISDQISQDHDLPIWKGEKLDMVLICCKASQCKQALQQWHLAISPTTQIVLLQNGLGQHDIVAHSFPNNAIFAASTTEGAFRNQNQDNSNIVTHAGKGQTQWGFYAGQESAFKLPLESLQGNHLWAEDIKQVLLDKLAINAIINPLTVKYHCQNGELLSHSDSLSDLKALCKETEQFFHSMHWSLSFDLFDKSQSIAKSTANNYSSMLQDIKNHRPTEIDFINGHLLNVAIANNFQLPLSQSLINLVKSYELEKKVC
jgi:2-dehydropantoate 2-reductase